MKTEPTQNLGRLLGLVGILPGAWLRVQLKRRPITISPTDRKLPLF